MINNAKILIIEDEKINRKILKELVLDLGHQPVMAVNGLYGLKVLENDAPDLVLLDINMPVMNGLEFLHHLEKERIYMDIPVIVISGSQGMDKVTECIELGAQDYLVKPFDSTTLKARIGACLERKSLRDKEKLHLRQLEQANSRIKSQNGELSRTNELLKSEIDRRKQAEDDLRQAQENALQNAHAAGMAEISGSVLHSIGNTLNNLDVSWSIMKNFMRSSSIYKLTKSLDLVGEYEGGIVAFLQHHPKGPILNSYLQNLSVLLSKERKEFEREVRGISKKLILMKEVMRTQKMFATGKTFTQAVDLVQLVEDMLQIKESYLRDNDIQIIRKFQQVPLVLGHKAKIGQLMLNLIFNAKEAMENAEKKEIILETSTENNHVSLRVTDTGAGISKNNLVKIFNHGFSTKKDRTGLGLHITATSMAEMSGKVAVASKGKNQGACFTLSWKAFKDAEQEHTLTGLV